MKEHSDFTEKRSYREPDKFAANVCQETTKKVFVILSWWP